MSCLERCPHFRDEGVPLYDLVPTNSSPLSPLSSPSLSPQSAKTDTTSSAGPTYNKLRATSEPPELGPASPSLAKKVSSLKNSLVPKRASFRVGSAKRPGSASTPSPVPPATAASAGTTAESSEEEVGHAVIRV